MAVFAQSQPFGLTEDALRVQPEDVEVALRSSEEWLARLTSNARFVVAIESVHDIRFDQPDLVIAAVQAVDDAVRNATSPRGTIPRSPLHWGSTLPGRRRA